MNDRAVGAALVALGLALIIVYALLLYAPPRPGLDWALVKATVLALAAAVGGGLAWLGYLLATAPPPEDPEKLKREMRERAEQLRRILEEEG